MSGQGVKRHERFTIHDILVISPQETISNILKERLGKFGYKVKQVSDLNELVNLEMKDAPGVCIVDGGAEKPEFIKDATAVLRDQCPDTHKMVVYREKLMVPAKDLFRSGIQSIYQIPFEEELILNTVFDVAPTEFEDKILDMDALVRISMMDFEDSVMYPFNTYICLPFNKKIMLYKRKNSPVEEQTVKKFKKNKHFGIYIKRIDLTSYHNFCAEKLTELSDMSGWSESNRSVRTEISRLLNGLISHSTLDGQNESVVLNTIKEITFKYLQQTCKNREMLEKISSLASQAFSNFNHSVNVATYASLFGMILGYKDTSDLFLGGLLHDIGHSETKEEFILNLDLDEKHTLNAIEILQRKGLDIPSAVQFMILQHHEHSDGSGFPNKIKSNEIHEYAKICAMADEFDKMTSVRLGQVRLKPLDAILEFAGRGANKADPRYDSDFHGKIVDAIMNPETIEIFEEAEDQEVIVIEEELGAVELDVTNIDSGEQMNEEDLVKALSELQDCVVEDAEDEAA